MESSRREFAKKYQISNKANNQKRYKGKGQYQKMLNFKRALATGVIALTATVSIVGCKNNQKAPEANTISTIESYHFEEPTKADGTVYTQEEKEHMNTVIQAKDTFVNKILEEYQKDHEGEQSIEEDDIGILKTAHYGTLIIDKKHEKILCSYTEENGQYKETVIENYADTVNLSGGSYVNDEVFQSIVDEKEYTLEDFVNGAEALYEYKTENYYEFEDQNKEESNFKEDQGYEIGD